MEIGLEFRGEERLGISWVGESQEPVGVGRSLESVGLERERRGIILGGYMLGIEVVRGRESETKLDCYFVT